MRDSKQKPFLNLRRLTFGIASMAPLKAMAAGSAEDMLDHLSSDTTIISILLSCTALLIGFLIRLQQMRHDLSHKDLALEKSEKQIQMMGDNLPNITLFQLFYSSRNHFTFNYLSKGFERTLGIPRDRVILDAQLAFDHIYEDDIPLLQEVHRQAMENLAPANIEIRALDLSGNLKWLRISAVAHRKKDLLVWDGFVHDISDSKAIEDALSEEKRNFQNLFDTIDDFLLVCDMNGTLLHTNPSVERRLGYSKDEMNGMSLFDLYPESLRAEAYQLVALMGSEQTTTCGFPLQMKSGESIPVEMNIFQGSWMNKMALFGVARDVAGRESTANALRESEQMLQLIMNTIPMSVFWKDKDSVYLGCNETFIKECNLTTADDVIGKKPADLFDHEMAKNLIVRDQQVISTNQPLVNALHSYTLSDGSVGWREINKIPLHDDEGKAAGILGVWRDITEQNRAEERLKRTLEDMERFNHLMRGRERRTLELKAEINRLLQELGRQTKYRTTTDDPG